MAWRQNNLATPKLDDKGKIKGFQKFKEGSRKGVPDIICVSPPHGRFIGLEIKVGKDRLSEHQVEFRDDLLKVNAQYHVISCIDDLMAIIKSDEMRLLSESDSAL